MLEISGLTKRYGNGTIALADFTLSLGEGVLGLLGPNGAGKTTLMSIVATVLRPTAGTVRWRGADALADPLAIRRELGYLPQDFGVYDKLTAVELAATSAASRGSPQGAQGGGRGDCRPRHLRRRPIAVGSFRAACGSGRHRAGPARRPKLLIVDEPTVGSTRGAGALPQPALGARPRAHRHPLHPHGLRRRGDRRAHRGDPPGTAGARRHPEELLAPVGRVWRAVVRRSGWPRAARGGGLQPDAARDGVHVRSCRRRDMLQETGSRRSRRHGSRPTLEDAYLLTTSRRR